MTSVNVRSVAALRELERGLARFTAEASTRLQSAEAELRQTETWLQERLNHWRQETQRRQAALQAAQAAYDRCRASGYRDQNGNYHQPSCSAEAAAAQRAAAQLQEAQAHLANAQRWQAEVGRAAAGYRAQASQLARALSAETPKGAAFVGEKARELETYLAANALAGGAVGATAASANQSAGANAGAVPSGGAVIGPRGAPIASIPLSAIDLTDTGITGPADFRKVSMQDMQTGLRMLTDVIAPAVNQGANADYFDRLDASQGLSGALSYRNIYDVFYGTDCIALDQIGNRYQVLNGRHRLFVAQQMGITSLPARIVGRIP